MSFYELTLLDRRKFLAGLLCTGASLGVLPMGVSKDVWGASPAQEAIAELSRLKSRQLREDLERILLENWYVGPDVVQVAEGKFLACRETRSVEDFIARPSVRSL